ncbi:GntR family transcriptional regulator [Clostridium sp. Marseille-Q2269]|uniref:GntR family transcriptional regulator n=1 Tax=Clostridium sp. Marseille-Q2269 TaxID=2942205 RepID=UPI002073BE3E|nr:GntR family transcriptional regulator [Clostridium sp. Marseille-Q2269]
MIDKKSHIPLYEQLKDEIQRKIDIELKPGDSIPTELEIEKMYNVSRMTVRRAIHELVLEGVIQKKQGSGTFVQEPKIVHNVERITSFTEEMKEKGMILKTVSTEINRIDNPSKKLVTKLNLSPFEKVIQIKRLRYVNNEPFIIMINYLREKYVEGIKEKRLNKESLYDSLENEYGIILERADETLEARESTEFEAENLEIDIWSPVLYLERLSYIKDNIPIEFTNVTIRGDKYKYNVSLYGRNKIK